jgi:hypothetical protein
MFSFKTLLKPSLCCAVILWVSCSNFINDYADKENDPCPGKSWSSETYVDLNGPNETGSVGIVADCYYMYVGGRYDTTPYIYKISIATHEINYAVIPKNVFSSIIVGNYIWAVGGGTSIQKINRNTLSVEWSNSTMDDPRSTAFDGTYIWCADRGITQNLHRIHPTNYTIDSYSGIVQSGARHMVFDGRYLWLTCSLSSSVLRIDPNDRTYSTISVSNAWGICYTGEYIIVAGAGGVISKIDPQTAAEVDSVTIPGCSWLCHCSFDGTYVWCPDNSYNNIRIIDPADLSLVNTMITQNMPIFSYSDGKYQWVTAESSIHIDKLMQ